LIDWPFEPTVGKGSLGFPAIDLPTWRLYLLRSYWPWARFFAADWPWPSVHGL